MRYLINFYISTWEWLEDRRGRTAASQLQNAPETKKIRTFLSQGAVGCAIGYFTLMTGYAVVAPVNFNFLVGIAVPFIFVAGAVWGSLAGFLVWLAGKILQRKLNVLHRVLVIGLAMFCGSLGISYLINPTGFYQLPVALVAVSSLLLYTPIVWLTGSKIRPGHLIFLGVGEHRKQYNFGDWLAYPAGFLLRCASILGLFEVVLLFVLWVKSCWVDDLNYPTPEDLPAIVIALLYFFLSSYFSVVTPRKAYVLPTAILVNLPLLVLLGYLRQFTSGESQYVSFLLLTLIGLWAIYTIGRLIAPEPVLPEIDLRKNFGVIQKTSPHRGYTVYP